MIIDNDIRLAGDLEKFELIEYKLGHIDLTSNDMINNATIKQIESSLKESNFEKLEMWFDSKNYFALVLAKKSKYSLHI